MREKIVGLVLAVGLVAGAVVTAGVPAGATTPRWTIRPSPSPLGAPSGELSSVSCASPTTCFAVGITDPLDGSAHQPLIEQWNGASWSIVPSPQVGATREVELDGVACPTATSCLAVGSIANNDVTAFAVNGLALRWNGIAWSVVPSPKPSTGDVQLTGVSCSSATDCVAVGSSTKFSNTAPFISADPLIEHWNGTRWSIVAGPNAGSGVLTSGLRGVSCVSATSCFAVGSSISKAGSATLVERWDGATWSIVASPTPAGSGSDIGLIGVECASDSNCFAVGNGGTNTLVERWDGAAWSIAPSPSPHAGSDVELDGVACSSDTNCFAVGTFDNAGGTDFITLIEHWDGSTWSIVPGARNSLMTQLVGVACPLAAGCFAVGDDAIAQQWDGTSWTTAAFRSRSSQSHLYQVACASPDDCFAVGSFADSQAEKTLIEHWDGSSWAIVPSPNPANAFESQLFGVTCVSHESCTAVGGKATDANQLPLIEHWNGKRWSIVAAADPHGADAAVLRSVSCPSASSCNAVGVNVSQTEFAPLAEHWNGKAWSIVPTATATPSSNPKNLALAQLIGVSCANSTSCMAVGTYTAFTTAPPSITSQPLIEQWNGTSWSRVAAPVSDHPSFAGLIGVSCPRPTNCTAVGTQQATFSAASSALAAHWDGTRWTIASLPKLAGAAQSALSGVACRSALSCYAVGSVDTKSGTHTLVEHSNGAPWAHVPAPSPGGTSSASLNGIACPSATTCIAVGWYGANGGSLTLAERGT